MAEVTLPDYNARAAAAAVCRLKLIGHMEAWAANGESVLPIGRKTRALFAIIAISAPRPVLRTRLADLLWSRRHEEQARASLRQELHRLLEALQPLGTKILDVTRDHIVLRPDCVWIDAQQVLGATTVNPSALTLFEGELLEEFDDVDPALDQWLASERHRLRDQARTVAEAVLVEQDEVQHSIPAAQRLLSIDRSHEGAWRALMHGYAARGERGKAIQAYEQCRTVLTDLLNAAPLPDTQRLAAEIRAGHVPMAAAAGPAESPPPLLVRTHTAVRVGVLTPVVISAGVDEQQFSLGLTEELTVALSRFNWMMVVSSSSLAQFGQRSETALRAAFGIDFLLDGSIQRVGVRLRITLRLLDLRDSSQVIWTYRSDQQIKDLLVLQDEVAAEVASQVDLEMLRVEGRLVTKQAPQNSAYDLVVGALPLLAKLNRDEFAQAGDMLENALRIDPDNAPAHSWRAWWLSLGIGQGWPQPGGRAVAEAIVHAERAIALQSQDARALTIAGHIRATLQHRPAEGLELLARARVLNPSLAMAWGLSAVAHLCIGNPAAADMELAHFRRLSPSDPNAAFFDAVQSLTHLLNHDFEAAIMAGRRATELSPNHLDAQKHYLAALGHARRRDEAETVLDKVLAAEPGFSVQRFLSTTSLGRRADRDVYARGLELAGVPEGQLSMAERETV